MKTTLPPADSFLTANVHSFRAITQRIATKRAAELHEQRTTLPAPESWKEDVLSRLEQGEDRIVNAIVLAMALILIAPVVYALLSPRLG